MTRGVAMCSRLKAATPTKAIELLVFPSSFVSAPEEARHGQINHYRFVKIDKVEKTKKFSHLTWT